MEPCKHEQTITDLKNYRLVTVGDMAVIKTDMKTIKAVLFAIFVAVLGQIVFSVSQKEIDDTQTNTGFNDPRPLSAGG